MTLNFELTGPDFKVPKDIKHVLEAMGTKRYVVSMTPVFAQRSNRQNAYFHLLVNRIANASGGDKEEVKAFIKKRAMDMGYPAETDSFGRLILDEKGKAVPKPSHEANIKDMQILIEAAYYVAIENGIEIEPYVEPDQDSDGENIRQGQGEKSSYGNTYNKAKYEKARKVFG